MTASPAIKFRALSIVLFLLMAMFGLVFIAMKFHIFSELYGRLERKTGKAISEKVASAPFYTTNLYQALLSFPDVKDIEFVGSADFPVLSDEGVAECGIHFEIPIHTKDGSHSNAENVAREKKNINLVFTVSRNKVYPGNVLTKKIIDKMAESYPRKLPSLTSIIAAYSNNINNIQGTCSPNVLNAISLDSYKLKP